MLGIIFRKAQNKIQDPAKLRRLIADLINREQWMILDADVKGDAYEGLLEKNAQDTKTGAGQYFTPRALIQAIVEVMHPRPGETICDPACGTGGFLLAAHDYLATHYPDLDREEKRFLRLNTLHGVEIVDGVTRLCAMNLLLHGIGPTGDEAAPPVMTDDSLRSQPGTHYRIVTTNPPFGKKSSVMVVNDEGDEERQALEVVRPDFWATTSNKQLNFLQHVKSLLEINGRAAVVVQIMSCLKVGLVRRCGGDCSMKVTCIPCSGFPQAFSMPRASKPTSFSSTGNAPVRPRGPRTCGSTTCGPTCTSP